MRLNQLTPKQVRDATAAVRRALRECDDAAFSGRRREAYAAAERAEHAAHELKQLFTLTADELETVLGRRSSDV